MKLEGEQTLLRVILRNTDRHGWFSGPAAEQLVSRARAAGLAGATVLRGIFGLDVRGQLLETKAWALVEHAPVIVEIIDAPAAIGRFLGVVEEVVAEGVATLERGHVLLFRSGPQRGALSRDLPGAVAPGSCLPSPEEFPVMGRAVEGQLLRVFIGESDVWQGRPLYHAIVLKAKELGLAGATVLRGPMGFGAHSRIHTANLLELSTDLPVVVEIVDQAERIQALLPFLDESVAEGLITLEGVRILWYGTAADRSPKP